MSKYSIIILTSLLSCKSFPQNSNNDIAQKEFVKNYNIVKEFVKVEKGTVPTNEILFLVYLTGIESFYFPGTDITYSPTKENLNAWKSWYEKNKELLKWDNQKNKVYLENEINSK